MSYAHVDDLADPNAECGWVSTLIVKLKNRLSQLLGRQDAYTLWWDPELAGNVRFTPEIMGNLDNSAILLVVLSRGYLVSDWCRRESDAFLEKIRSRYRDGSRLFIVEPRELNGELIPGVFREYGRYKFWEKDPRTGYHRTFDPNTDTLYNNVLDGLARDMARKIDELRPSPSSACKALDDDARDGGLTVFLAEPTEDLYSRREKVASCLDQLGVRIVPGIRAARYSMEDADALRSAVDRDMAGAKLFVQLLGSFPSERPAGVGGGHVGHQHRRAVELGLPVLQWRHHWLDEETIRKQVEDQDHRALLSGPDVQCSPLEDFCSDLARQVERMRERDRRLAESPPPPGECRSVFVSYYTGMDHDREVANAICGHLERRGLDAVTLPPEATDEKELREDMRYWLLDYPCRGAIVVHGRTSGLWVRRQVGEIRKMAVKLPLAVYQGPPTPKTELGVRLHNLKLIDCANGPNETLLDEFIAMLGAEAPR